MTLYQIILLNSLTSSKMLSGEDDGRHAYIILNILLLNMILL